MLEYFAYRVSHKDGNNTTTFMLGVVAISLRRPVQYRQDFIVCQLD